MVNRVIIFLVLASGILFISCIKKVEPVDTQRIIGVWKRIADVSVTTTYAGRDTVRDVYDNEYFHLFSDNGEYVEYQFIDTPKSYYLKGTYKKVNTDIIVSTAEGYSKTYAYKFSGEELWLTVSESGSTKVYYQLKREY